MSFVAWAFDLTVAGRIYTVYGATNLTDGVWLTPTNSATRFYKVEVRMP